MFTGGEINQCRLDPQEKIVHNAAEKLKKVVAFVKTTELFRLKY